jgi:hypothetical protein
MNEWEFRQYKRDLAACETEPELDAVCNEILRQSLPQTIQSCRETLATMDRADEECDDPEYVPFDRGWTLVVKRRAEKMLAELDAGTADGV